MVKYARCNADGRPIHPGDQAVIGKFRKWLALTDGEKYIPEWHSFLGFDCEKWCNHPPIEQVKP